MLNIALKQADGVGLDGQPNTKLRQIADKLVEQAIAGEGWAIKEVADRVDGKVPQGVVGADDGAVEFVHTIRRQIIKASQGGDENA